MDAQARTGMTERGVRTQVVMATGSGKTLVAQRAAEALRAARVLVLVPSLDLLTQTAAAWREGGRTGPLVGVSSLRGDEAGFPSTTDAEELGLWCRGLEKVTVFATYASLGLGTLERAHRAGLEAWSLICVDEAHRTSGTIGKPWSVVHDNRRVPADRRLYMTATPRLWQLARTVRVCGLGSWWLPWTTMRAGCSGRAVTLCPCRMRSIGVSVPHTRSWWWR
ncbi:DEAD/DEAH box helicase family protein [Streptomyces sp. NPDC059909]|uniref:DEAD/DEAH box helicase family protein n=1 Tax=Streptomyces sp. NPDC059909 TaxID=3346998 RepID=UPI003653B07F